MTHTGLEALTEREKQALRLLLAGHDAKSAACALGLSVHTVNERLRDARRKLAVSSSKAAARLLLAVEGPAPQSLGDMPIGDAVPAPPARSPAAPIVEPAPPRRVGWVLGGCLMLSILAAAVALTSPSAQPAPAEMPAAATPGPETAAGQAARAFLALVDAGDWGASYAATGRSFQRHNTLAVWTAASEKARVPLGRTLSRTLVGDWDTPSPPPGLRTVRFRTDYANRQGATETLSLDREGGAWKVMGIYIE